MLSAVFECAAQQVVVCPELRFQYQRVMADFKGKKCNNQENTGIFVLKSMEKV